jgi:hypothetical protein
MSSLVLGSPLAFFPGVRSDKLSFQAAPRDRPIAFAPEGFARSLNYPPGSIAVRSAPRR